MNGGASPVRVLAVESGCGCAKPVVEPRLIKPGGPATVSVHVQGLDVGERTIPITVETDSPVTPHVLLTIRHQGYVQPPYLFRAGGELTWSWGDATSESAREIILETVETVETTGRPEPRSDLEFLQIGPPVVTSRPNVNDPKLVGRMYRFPVKLSPAPEEAFSGIMEVADPWNPGRSEVIRVHGEPGSPLRVSPSRLLLDASGTADREVRARLLVRVRDPRSDVEVEAAPDSREQLTIEPVPSVDAGPSLAFEVRPQPGRPLAAGMHRIVVRTTTPQAAEVIVPVLVRAGEAPP